MADEQKDPGYLAWVTTLTERNRIVEYDEEGWTRGLTKTHGLMEIAYNLSRIADALERQASSPTGNKLTLDEIRHAAMINQVPNPVSEGD